MKKFTILPPVMICVPAATGFTSHRDVSCFPVIRTTPDIAIILYLSAATALAIVLAILTRIAASVVLELEKRSGQGTAR